LATDRVLPPELASATSAIVCDALDRVGLREQALDPAIRPLWPEATLVGRAMPVVVVAASAVPEQPYDGEMAALDALEPGDVAVFEVEPGVLAASWGELFSCGAIGRGAVGALCDGYVRDARQIEAVGFPTFARGFSPYDTLARAVVASFGEQARCGGVVVSRGDVVVADRDGAVVVPAAKVDEVAALVGSKRRLEDAAREDLLAGMRIREVWDKYQVF
jgi:4-hydroxy-4-methyl-2-oxoglutarate aldolase